MRITRSYRRLLVITCPWWILLQAPALGAEDALGAQEQYRFTLDFGYRWKPYFRGSNDLYRSHLDYGEGPKLAAGDLLIAFPQDSNRWFDRLLVNVGSWGGEPYNSGHIRGYKAGLYDLRFDYRNVHYFNSFPSFANPLFTAGDLETQHRYDVSQRLARLQVTLRPGQSFSLHFAYERGSRFGPVRTTVSAGGEEFELGSDLRTGSHDLRGGIKLNLRKFSLLLEQAVRWHSDDTSFYASGSQTGNSTRRTLGRDITLNKYLGRNDFEIRIPYSTGTATYRPWESLFLKAKVSYSMADTESRFVEEAGGTFFSRVFSGFYAESLSQTSGVVKKPSLLGDFSATWEAHPRLRFIEHFQTRRFHISGSALTNSTFLNVEPLLQPGIIDQLQTSTPFQTFFSLNQETQEMQAVVSPARRLVFRLGYRYERKELQLSQARYPLKRHVFISGLSFDFAPRNYLAAEYELGRTDQPIVRTDPVDFNRLRVRGRFSPSHWLEVTGSVTLFDNDGLSTIDLISRQRDYSLQVLLAPLRRFSLSAEYERSDVRTNLLFIIPQTFISDRSLYRERGNYGSLFLSFILMREAKLNLGYSIWGTAGNFPLTYHRPLASLEIPLGGRITAYGGWNYYDYNEKLQVFPQDYRTHLVTAGVRILLEGQ